MRTRDPATVLEQDTEEQETLGPAVWGREVQTWVCDDHEEDGPGSVTLGG